MSFSLGGIFGGVTKGIESGLKYDAAFLSSMVWAIKSGNKEALNALVKIAQDNIHETVDTAGNILPNIVAGLIAGSDPFAGSRHEFQNWQTKFGKH